MAKKKNSPQSPIDMTQEELDGIKRGDLKISRTIQKRIASINLPKAKAASRKSISSQGPVKVSGEQLKGIKKTGKIPSALRSQIEKEKKNKEGSTKYKHPEHAEPKFSPGQKQMRSGAGTIN